MPLGWMTDWIDLWMDGGLDFRVAEKMNDEFIDC